MNAIDDFFEDDTTQASEQPSGLITEAAEEYFNFSKRAEVGLMKLQAFSEAAEREHGIQMQRCELKVMKENGTPEDLVFLEEAAEEGFTGKLKKLIQKAIQWWIDFIRTVKTKFAIRICSTESKATLKKVEKRVKLNPILAKKKVQVESAKKPLSIINRYKSKVDKVSAKCIKGLFGEHEMKTLADTKKEFEEEFKAATTGKAALVTITVAALVSQVLSDVEKLPSYLDYCEKNNSEILKKLQATVDPETAAAATAATNMCINFRNELAKAEVDTHISAIQDGIKTLKENTLRKKGNVEAPNDFKEDGEELDESGFDPFEESASEPDAGSSDESFDEILKSILG